MTTADQIAWLCGWCAAQGLDLELDGEVGFGRECVGILATGGEYVDYDRYDTDYEPIPGQEALGPNEDTPDAYHKHDCLAVLGSGGPATAQLYAWVHRLAELGAVIERDVPKDHPDFGAVFFGQTTRTRIVLPEATPA